MDGALASEQAQAAATAELAPFCDQALGAPGEVEQRGEGFLAVVFGRRPCRAESWCMGKLFPSARLPYSGHRGPALRASAIKGVWVMASIIGKQGSRNG